MTGANFSVTSEGGVPHSKLHHPNSIILFMPVVDMASCDWRHALHRLIGILNWKTAGEKYKYRHPENHHMTARDTCQFQSMVKTRGVHNFQLQFFCQCFTLLSLNAHF